MLRRFIPIVILSCLSLLSSAQQSTDPWVLFLGDAASQKQYDSHKYLEQLEKEGVNLIRPDLDELPDTLTLEDRVKTIMTQATKTTRMPIQILTFGKEDHTALLASELYPQFVDRIMSIGGTTVEDQSAHCPRRILNGDAGFRKSWKEVSDFLDADLKHLLNIQRKESKKVLFDLSHGQCTDVMKGYETYPYLLPAYLRLLDEVNADLIVNYDKELSGDLLKDVDLVLMTSPLSSKLQKNLTSDERMALSSFVANGHSLIFFIDDFHRCDNDAYGANDVTSPFGVTFEKDVPLPGNVGAVSIENGIFSKRLEIPFSGATLMRGGVPVSLTMQGGYVHSSVVEHESGGKLYAGSDTMVGLLLGFADGEILSFKGMGTRWWGKDAYEYMKELITWMLSD